MTPDRVLAVLEKYDNMLSEGGCPTRMEAGQEFHKEPERADHILWMCIEARKHVEAGKVDKAMRWLGFIQGVLWADGVLTLAEMKDDNR